MLMMGGRRSENLWPWLPSDFSLYDSDSTIWRRGSGNWAILKFSRSFLKSSLLDQCSDIVPGWVPKRHTLPTLKLCRYPIQVWNVLLTGSAWVPSQRPFGEEGIVYLQVSIGFESIYQLKESSQLGLNLVQSHLCSLLVCEVILESSDEIL